MKHLLRILIILIILTGFSSGVTAQSDDPCQADAVVAAFADAVANGEVDQWLATVGASDCPSAVVGGAEDLAAIYLEMQESAGSSGTLAATETPLMLDVPFVGQDPVVSYANALGINVQIEVDSVQTWDSHRCIYIASGQTTLEIASGVFLAAGLSAVRQFDREGERVTAHYADGQVFEGHADFVVEDSEGNSYGIADATKIQVISLPESRAHTELTGLDPDKPVWELEMPSAGLTFQGTDPTFRYRYVSCSTIVLGISGPFRTSSSFTFALDEDQSLDVNLSDLAALDLNGSTATITVPSGQETTGTFTLEDAGGRWYLYLTLGYGRKVWVDSSTPFTLRQVSE
jgi:hypothetical protein